MYLASQTITYENDYLEPSEIDAQLTTRFEWTKEIENVLTSSCSVNNFIKASYAPMEDAMNDHARKEFNAIVDRFEAGTPIREHLDNINSVLNESSLQFNANTLSSVQETQASITEYMIQQHQDKGLDADNVNTMMHNTIMEKSLEEKRAFYKDFRDTIKSIQSKDEPWLRELSENLKASLDRTKKEILENNQSTTEAQKVNAFTP